MRRQIRRGVFETNSSSTHSLTMMMKSDYDRWQTEQLYLYEGGYGWKFKEPIKNNLYTKDEVMKFAKNNRYYHGEEEIDNETMRDMGFISWDDEGNEYLEGFYEGFTTPSGETIVAFGEYGYDG
jgi:hypothetical protein